MIFSCGKKEVDFVEDGSQYIVSMTQSNIARDAKITVVFNEDIKNKSNISQVAKFQPEQKGSWEITDERTITFTPETFFDCKTQFELALDVGKLFGKSGNKIGIKQAFFPSQAKFEVSLGFPESETIDTYSVPLTVATDIDIATDEVAKVMSAKYDNKVYEIFFNEGSNPTKNHRLKIKNLTRKPQAETLTVSYNAKGIGFADAGEVSQMIPAEDSFEILNASLTNDRTVVFTFSELLDENIDLREFISVTSSDTDYTYHWQIEKNNLSVTCSRISWSKDTVISILPNFKSARGHLLEQGMDYQVVVGWKNPSIQFADNNVILPSEGKPVVVVYTKNLSGLIIEAVKIPKHNMLQFLQINDLQDNGEMYRVGESVWQKAFDFAWTDDMKNRFVTRGLDLTELVNQFPDGMFQLKITFAHRHAKYKSASEINPSLEFPSDFVNFSDNTYTTYWEGKNRSNTYRFWEFDDDPNHPAFYLSCYNRDALKTKNVLVSNLALSVKLGTDGETYIQAVNLLTSEAEKNTEIKLYNFTQSLIEEGSADANGTYKVKTKESFSFIQAKSGNNYAYLSLNSAPLSTSHFQVGGVKTYDGVKGFVYGERGVWRPGDKLHLCLIIQDSKKSLPDNVPIVFTLEDPMGKIIDKQVLNEGVNGFYKIETKTSQTDLTGTWIARFKTGNNIWTKQLKIESVIPNKLAINLNVENDFFNSGQNPVKLSSEWLTGVKASGLKSEIYSRYLSKNYAFENFKEYNFNNIEYYTSTSFSKIWEGNLDENGNANFNLKLDAGKNLSGLLNAVFETRVYEPSGAYSIETKAFDFSPFSRYVGLKLPKSDADYRDVLYLDKTHTAEIVLVDETGKLVNTNAEVELSVYKLEWSWWWVRDAYTNASYDQTRSASKVFTKKANAKNGKLNINFEINKWGRYLFVVSDTESGHSSASIAYLDDEYWATRSDSDVEGSANMLVITSNKDKYNTNETAEVSFNANLNSTAYITIEKNGSIIKQDIVKTVDGTNTYKFKTDIAMCPNVYVHISLVQAYKDTVNSLPFRLYGIIPVMIEDKTTRLNPVVKNINEFKPNEKCKIRVSEKDGKVATFTLAVVDEGLLGLTAFKTANPWDYFFSKESSQILSYDIFNLVSGAIKGELQTLIAVGGGGMVDESLANKTAERFKPVVFYFGPIELKKGETKELEFQMPEYIGEVRLMAVFANEEAYGMAEEKVKVKSDLMLSPTLPRTIGVGETIQLPVTVFNTTETRKKVSVQMDAKGANVFKNSETVELAANSNKTIFFKMPFDNAGTNEISFVAKEGFKEVSRSTTEIAVASRGMPYEIVKTFAIKSNEKINQAFETIGENGSKAFSIEVSKNKPIGVEKHLNYLLSFPHGCVEQITSKVFAQLYLHKMLNLNQKAIADIKNNINDVISRYSKYQLQNGGFAYWQGGTEEHPWASAYVLHFLTEAKRAGYYVEQTMYNSLMNRIETLASSFSSNQTYESNAQSYRLFALAQVGKANIGAMNRLNRNSDLSPYAKSLLAYAYVISGNHAQGHKIVDEITTQFPSYRKTGSDFSSTIRDLAITCTVAKQIKHSSADARFEALSRLANNASWLSTQEATWLLIAASNFFEKSSNENITYEIEVAGKKIKNNLNTNSEIHNIALNDNSNQNVLVKNTGKNNFFVTIRYTSTIPSTNETYTENGIALNVNYLKKGASIPTSQLKMGDNFTVKFTIANNSSELLENLILSFPIPTGWEISNERLGGEVANKNYSYLDIKDDHIYVHFDLPAKELKTFEFNTSLSYGGNYFVPAVTCEAMYDNTIRANNVGAKMEAY